MRHLVIILISTLLPAWAHSQSIPFIGGRANGLAYASSCLSDEWAVFNNPAGAASPKGKFASTSADVFPNFTPWNRIAAVYLSPLANGGLNIGVFKSGDHLFNEQRISAAYANKFGITSLGLSAQLIQYRAEGFGSRLVPSFSFGGITELYPWLTLGASIINVTQPEVADGERIPSTITAGISVTASEKVKVFAEVEKTLPEKPCLKVAVEYEFHKKFTVRTGFHPEPAAGFFGLGFRRRKLKMDYAMGYVPSIGLRHQTCVAFCFNPPK